MPSEHAKNVAKQVLENIGNGEKINMGKILREKGYADNTADNPKLVTETKTYKEVVEPIVNRWQREIQRIQSALEGRDLNDEKYKDLVDSLDKLNKNVQLATGGATDNVAVSNVITFKDFHGASSQSNI